MLQSIRRHVVILTLSSLLVGAFGASSAVAGKASGGSPKKHVKKYRKMVEKAPEDAQSWYNLTVAYVLLQDWEQAVKAGETAVRLSPEDSNAVFRLGEALQGTGKTDAAVSRFETAVELDPAFYEAWANLAGAYSDSKRYEEAVKAYKKALRTKPEHPGPLYTGLGDAYFKMGDVPNATKWFERTLEANPNDPNTHYNLGAVFKQLARKENDKALYSRSADAFLEVLKLTPKDCGARFHALEALLFGGRNGEAKTVIEDYKRLCSGESAQKDSLVDDYLTEANR